MKRAAAVLLSIVGVALAGAGTFALGAAALDPANPFNSFNIVYGAPALVLGVVALAGAVWAWRSRGAAAPRR
jgi:protein-S-isoprenylcysteine O-methyltransferase Ste14